jgi:hypothetical protein
MPFMHVTCNMQALDRRAEGGTAKVLFSRTGGFCVAALEASDNAQALKMKWLSSRTFVGPAPAAGSFFLNHLNFAARNRVAPRINVRSDPPNALMSVRPMRSE